MRIGQVCPDSKEGNTRRLGQSCISGRATGIIRTFCDRLRESTENLERKKLYC